MNAHKPYHLAVAKPISKGYRLANEIAAEIADQYGLTLEDVKGPCKRRVYVDCREEIVRTIKARMSFSLPEIGMVINREHTAVLYLLRRGN